MRQNKRIIWIILSLLFTFKTYGTSSTDSSLDELISLFDNPSLVGDSELGLHNCSPAANWGIEITSRDEWGALDLNKKHENYECYNYLNHQKEFGITKDDDFKTILEKIYGGGRIIIHHTDSQTDGPKLTQETIHMTRKGWMDIGYHFFIDKKGKVYQGRSLFMMGRHSGKPKKHEGSCSKTININEDYDFRSIGITLQGRYHLNPDIPAAQLNSLNNLINFLRVEYKLKYVQGHNHYSERITECPGEYLINEINSLYKSILDPMKKKVKDTGKLNEIGPTITCGSRCKK